MIGKALRKIRPKKQAFRLALLVMATGKTLGATVGGALGSAYRFTLRATI
jgi:hypothetical protein